MFTNGKICMVISRKDWRILILHAHPILEEFLMQKLINLKI